MIHDPAPWIIAAALVSGSIGFFGSALLCARIITDVERKSYRAGYDAANRELNKPKL